MIVLAIIYLSTSKWVDKYGALAQLGERHVCTVEVSGSIPLCSTILIITLLSSVFLFIIKEEWFMGKVSLVFDFLNP